MAGQGFVNEGSDKRVTTLWGLGPWLNQKFSFHSGWDPVSVYLVFPLGFGINLPALWKSPGWVLHMHLYLFRYDRNWPGYLFFSSEVKVQQQPEIY
jgi:hypothetical protein